MKLGLFIHFGPWSQTGEGAIWKIAEETDPLQRAKFFDLYKTFNPTHFDADAWAKTAQADGFKYVVFTAKHHDGFSNFDTALSDIRSTSPLCPAHADLTAEVAKSFSAQGLDVGIYYSNLDWRRIPEAYLPTGFLDPPFPQKSPQKWADFVNFQQGQVRELLNNYGHIGIFWFDIPWPPEAQPSFIPMLQMMRNLDPDVILDDRGTANFGDFATTEQRLPDANPSGPWEANYTISEGRGYWYKGPKATYKSSADLIHLLADIVSRGGNLLLDIGPKPDGTWTDEETSRLNDLGRWLSVNGSSIYNTRADTTDPVPPWGRITRGKHEMNLIIFDWPMPGTPLKVITTLKPTSAHMLADSASVKMRTLEDGSGFEMTLPPKAPDPAASVVKLELP